MKTFGKAVYEEGALLVIKLVNWTVLAWSHFLKARKAAWIEWQYLMETWP